MMMTRKEPVNLFYEWTTVSVIVVVIVVVVAFIVLVHGYSI